MSMVTCSSRAESPSSSIWHLSPWVYSMFIPQREQMLEKSNAMGTALRCMLTSSVLHLTSDFFSVDWLLVLLLQEIKKIVAARILPKMKYFLMGVLILVRR